MCSSDLALFRCTQDHEEYLQAYVRRFLRLRAQAPTVVKAGSGDSSAATETRRWPESTVAAARRTAGERGQREIGRGRGNWGAFRVADVGVELTGARGAVELQRRRGTELGTTGLWRRRSACAQRGGKDSQSCASSHPHPSGCKGDLSCRSSSSLYVLKLSA